MNTRISIAGFAFASFLVFLPACEKKVATGSTTPPAPTNPTPAADNTATNKADRGTDSKTPMDQSQAAADINITAAIRRAIMAEKDMSMNGQNCKVITDKGGIVTLRGVVNSQAERDSIEAMAKSVAGVTKVDNQLEIKPG